jgi:diguanylate cyclase (GGDEF)-like protein
VLYSVKNRAIFVFPLLCLILTAVLIGASLASPRGDVFLFRPTEIHSMNEGWALTVDGADQVSFSLPGYTGAGAGELVALEQTLPERGYERVYLLLHTTQQYVRAYVNDTLIYSYGATESLPYSKTPGSIWNSIDLSSAKAGDVLRLEFLCEYESRASSLGGVLIGPRYALFTWLIQTHAPPAVISGLTMLCGIILTLVGMYLFHARRITSLFHLGLFCVTASIWCLMESNAMDLLIPYPFFTTQLGHICLMLCPVPMLLFLRSFFDLREDELCNGLILGGCVVFCTAVLLQLFNVIDLFVTIASGYGVIVIYAVYFFIVMVRRKDQLDRIGGVLFRAAVAAIALFTLADLVVHVLYLRELVADKQDLAYYFRIGILFFILLLAAVCIRQIFIVYRRGVETDVLKRMLEIDLMTGLHSRRNFDSDMEAFRKSPPNERLAMIMFDLNNLKQVNDTLGHKRGDDLIKATAALIHEVFSVHGLCYRIGGDEFVAILPDIEHALLEAKIAAFDSSAADCARNGDLTIDTAVGYGFFSPGIDADISALFTRVDDAMYRNKRLRKSGRAATPTETTGRRSTDMREMGTEGDCKDE